MTRWMLRLNDRVERGLEVVERLLVSVVALLLVGFAVLGILNDGRPSSAGLRHAVATAHRRREDNTP